MWVSTKAQYGLRALIDIGQRPGVAVPLKDVAQRQDISQHYLEQIASNLRRAGFIRSVRGAHGGYRLSRLPETINTWDVVVAMEGSIASSVGNASVVPRPRSSVRRESFIMVTLRDGA